MSGNQPPPPPNFGNQPPPPGQVPPPAGQVPPPAGGYQTPPPGGYGTPPTPGDQPWDIGSAFSWGWAKFQQNVAQLIIAALAIFAGVVVYVIAYIIIAALSSSDVTCSTDSNFNYSCDTTGGLPWIVQFGLTFLLLGVLFLFITVIQVGMARGALGVTEGRPFKAAEVFKFENIGQVILLGLIYAVGFLLCVFPGVILSFLGSYALFFIVDRNMGAVDALKASTNMITKDFGRAGVWALLALVITAVGEAVCGVGLLVAFPVALLGSAYTYKKLNGQPVAA